MAAPTENDLYRGINRRFDRRAALLRQLGFRYHIAGIPVFGEEKPASTGIFFRRQHGRTQIITASFVLCSPNWLWLSDLSRTLTRSR